LENRIKVEKKVAVVLLSYNNTDLNEKFIPPILAEKERYDNFELILVDNASTDGTEEYINKNFPEVKVLRLDVNRGFTNGYVQSLKQIDAEYYVLLSSDFEVTPGWIQPIVDLMDKDSTIAACQPKIKYYKQKTHFEYAGAAGGYIDKYGYPFCRGRIFFDLEEDKGQYDDTREVFWAGGGCMFIRSELYHQFGGLDNDFYAHMEEIDLCWRLKNGGYRIMVCPESTVYHVGGAVITYGSPIKVYYNFRNGLILMVKNLPKGKLFGTILMRLILDHIAAYKALFSGNFKEYFAIAKAHFHFFIGSGKWLRKRKEAQAHTTTPNNTGYYKRSIVLDYFLRGKKKFSDLNIN